MFSKTFQPYRYLLVKPLSTFNFQITTYVKVFINILLFLMNFHINVFRKYVSEIQIFKLDCLKKYNIKIFKFQNCIRSGIMAWPGFLFGRGGDNVFA